MFPVEPTPDEWLASTVVIIIDMQKEREQIDERMGTQPKAN